MNNEELPNVEISNEDRELLEKITKLEEAGFSDDEIEKMLGLGGVEIQDFQQDEPIVRYDLPEMNFDFRDYDEKAIFKEKPPKPDFFKAKEQLKKFRQAFQLKSDQIYVLNDEERKVKKLNLRDVMRISHKTPRWAAYLGYNAPEMLVDDLTGQYRFADTLLTLFERAFGDYDEELDRPTDFGQSVLEEMCSLLNLKNTVDENGEPCDPVDYLLSCDPDEVYEAVAKLITYNQGFFTKLWNALGPIKNLSTLIFGTISNKIKELSALQSLGNSGTKVSQSNELE